MSCMSSNIQNFLQKIVDQVDQGDISPEQREQMVKILGRQLDSALLAAALQALPEEKMPEYDALINSQPTAEQVQQYLMSNVPDIENVYRAALLAFRQKYIAEE